MTQQHSQQSDDAHDESTPRRSTVLTERVVENERDVRIDASIKRLFAPPNIWPPLFNGVDGEDRSVAEAGAATGGDDQDRISIKPRTTQLSALSSKVHRRDGHWLRRAAVAACLMLGLFGMWMTWQNLPSVLPYSHQRPVTFEVGHLHEQFATGELPAMKDHSFDILGEGHWRIPETPLTIRLADLAQSTTSVEFFGAVYSEEVQACSPLLLMRIGETPIMMFADSHRYRYLAAAACEQSLHLHHRRVAQFDVYELSAHPSPMVLSHIECEGPDCHKLRNPSNPQCVSDVAP